MDPISSAAPVIRTTVGWSDTGCLFTPPTTTTQENPGQKQNVFELYSPDGIHWTPNAGAYISEFGSIAVSSSGVIVGLGETSFPDLGTIRTDDGIHWTTSLTPDQFVESQGGIGWSDSLGVFLAFGIITGAIDKVFTSSDGIIWTGFDYTFPVGLSGLASLDIIHVDELDLWLCGAAAQSSPYTPILYSSDGIHWTGVVVGGLVSGISLAWSPDLSQVLALIDDLSHTICYVATSPDGIHWTTHGVLDTGGSGAATHPVWSSTNHQWACASGQNIFTSLDGITWTTLDFSFLSPDFNGATDLIWSPYLNQYLLIVNGLSTGEVQFATSPDLVSGWTLGVPPDFYFEPTSNFYRGAVWYDPAKLWIVMGTGPSGEGGGGGTNPDTPPTSDFCSSEGTFDLPTVSNANPGPTSTYEP